MKKRVLAALSAVAFVACLASCDDNKVCYCYENQVEQTMYVRSDVPCSTYTTEKRGCIESNERGTIDPGSTAYK